MQHVVSATPLHPHAILNSSSNNSLAPARNTQQHTIKYSAPDTPVTWRRTFAPHSRFGDLPLPAVRASQSNQIARRRRVQWAAFTDDQVLRRKTMQGLKARDFFLFVYLFIYFFPLSTSKLIFRCWDCHLHKRQNSWRGTTDADNGAKTPLMYDTFARSQHKIVRRSFTGSRMAFQTLFFALDDCFAARLAISWSLFKIKKWYAQASAWVLQHGPVNRYIQLLSLSETFLSESDTAGFLSFRFLFASVWPSEPKTRESAD